MINVTVISGICLDNIALLLMAFLRIILRLGVP